MTPLTNLLRRVEGATGPDREIDALILCALAAPEGSWVEQSKINGAWCIYEGRRNNGEPRSWEYRGGWYRPDGWPLTASVDVTLALVERVLPDTVRPGFQQNPDRTWQAAILRVEPDDADCPVASEATAPLAILVALLKALIARSGSSQSSVPARC